ncbi:hypothetical protein O3P69_007736 [Scylla paramamosain]|uniref:Uncharacterized protein n=1 Tax=Scylla paramamosain TaxID=85552 RepID=A0AAW0V253_SCYPA
MQLHAHVARSGHGHAAIEDGVEHRAGILALVHLQHADRADQARLPRRLVKDHQNPFAAYSEEEFVQRYRLSKECIHTLLGQVEPDLPRAKDGRGCSIPAYIQLLTAMMYFATGSFQICMANCLGMSAASEIFADSASFTNN